MTNKLKPPTIENYQDLADSLPEYWHKHLNDALADAYHKGRNDQTESMIKRIENPTAEEYVEAWIGHD